MFSKYYLQHVFVILLLISRSFSADQYGPYNIDWKECRLCSENSKELLVSTEMTKPVPNAKSAQKSNTMFHFNFTVTTRTPFDKMKVEVFKIHENGNKVMIIKKNLVQPCQSLYFKAFSNLQLLKFIENSKTCILEKSSYTLDLNFDDLARTIIGDEFYYGEYYVRVHAISHGKVILCLVICSVIKNIHE